MSPAYYAELFYDYGFDFVGASQFPKNPGESVMPAKILSPKDKAVIVKKLCSDLGLDVKRSVAFGDSMSDCLLFQELEHTVSVNGDARLQALARYCYEGLDLHEAFMNVCNELLRNEGAGNVA